MKIDPWADATALLPGKCDSPNKQAVHLALLGRFRMLWARSFEWHRFSDTCFMIPAGLAQNVAILEPFSEPF